MTAEVLRLVSIAIAALLLTGCTAGSSSPDAHDPGFPPRPAVVQTATVDPCAMFDAAQQRALGLRRSTPRQATVNGLPSSGCVWLGENDLGYNTQTIPIGAQVAATDPAARVVDVNGFGAVVTTVREGAGGLPTCQATIDSSAGASIRVQAQETVPNRTEDELCRLATDAASLVMTTVAGSG